jgi:hypothetical protein
LGETADGNSKSAVWEKTGLIKIAQYKATGGTITQIFPNPAKEPDKEITNNDGCKQYHKAIFKG